MNLLSVTFKVVKSDFSLPVEPVGNSVRTPTGASREKAFNAVLGSSFHEEMSFSSDQTAAVIGRPNVHN